MRFTRNKISLLVSGLFLAGSALAQSTSNVGSITVEGNPGGTDSGLIQQEETPKARSSITREFIEKQAPTSNPFQMLNLLPGVNAFSYDATGLFGGGMRVRGFNTDQLGFTIDGAPVNDSGNFAVYPQEYTDSECIDNIFVTQGSTDVEAPHVGATGGNVGINTITPSDERNVRIAQTAGSNNLSRTFARADTGKLGMAKFAVCASKTRVDKFKGPGDADRDHIDVKAHFDFGGGNVVTAGLLYNRAVNANIRALNKSQIALYGNNYDFGSVAPVHQPFAGARINDATFAPNVAANITSNTGSIGDGNLGYYGLNLNPFENAVATLNGNFKLADNIMLNVNPYFWYGYGTGGNELKTLTDGTANGTKLHGDIAPFYSTAVTGNTIFAYNGSVTHTDRPGINVKVDADISPTNHLSAGVWYERARHRQTGPYVGIDNSGNAADLFMANPGQWLHYNDGSPIESRNYYTVSTGKSVYVQDNVSLIDNRLNLALGISDRSITRNLTNTASSESGGGADYSISHTYSDVLPNLGAKYQITKEQSVFFNAAQNFRAPPNYVLAQLVTGGTVTNGVLTGWTLRNPVVDKESSNNFDLGYRLQNDRFTLSGSLYRVDFKDRIATSYDPASNTSTSMNVGASRSQGVEMEAGWEPAKHWSLYGSLTVAESKMNEDKVVVKASNNAWVALPTTGKQFPDTPRLMAGLGVQYAEGAWFAYGQAKYTGKRYSTLLNDDSIGGYTAVNAGAGYEFASTSFFKKPQIKLNVYNVLNTGCLNLNAGSGASFTLNATAYTAPGGGVVSASLPSFYVCAPRTLSITLQSDF